MSSKLQNNPKMLLNQPMLFTIRFFLVLLFCAFSQFYVYGQESPLEIQIEEELQYIRQQIELKEYDEALEKIVELESDKKFIGNDSNRLQLELLKAKSFYRNKEEQEKTINILLKGLDELKLKPKLFKLKIEYTTFLGKIFESAKNYAKARDYYKISLNESVLVSDTLTILDSYRAIGLTFDDEERYDSAINYFKKAIAFPVTVKTSKSIAKVYNNLSGIAMQEDDLILAEEYANTSLQINEQQKDTLGIAITLVTLSNVLYKKREFEKVRENYLKAYNSVKLLKTERALAIKEGTLYNLAFVNEELKDFENAYYYLYEATDLTDSLEQASIAKNISEIEAKFNVAKEAQKVEEEKSKRLRTQVFFYSLAIAFLIFIILGYIFYRNYRLKQHNKLEQIENEVHTKIINATIDAKEKERKAIAETLHDSVSALLSSANLHLQATKSQLKKEAPKEITKAQSIVNEASVKIRDLSHELISSVLLKFGLAFAVHDMCQKYSNSEISLLSDDNGVKRYEQDFEIKIHNIIEELINNILKHSKASNATIMLVHRADDKLGIRINDDGVGFDVRKAKYKDGLGLSHINARIKVMKGVFTIESSEDEGTSIFILVPIQFKEVAA